ncbi:DUF4290 domain-containing protein [Taibaiella sp. KBW10]|uniref:DUF4290 domain-containing protein n=1 Tax=Taibaiella sp. KBW10 TaxID=2153357 RepID=UPI000F5B2060|nr:DUF4290 domain-containing protein [Taibaiella sp. KBW10]RQO31527.1 DUF4290 domain-containing protein [Taibaiella sp. KBW10]
MHYNTSRNKLLMPEYGRNIQKMVDYIITIEDTEKRQQNAQAIIELMGILNPHLKNVEDFRHKLWDHIYRISDFKIEIDSPYPIPTREKMFQKPEPLPYPKKNRKNKHIGHNISQIIDRAIQTDDEDKRKGFTQSVAYYMKLSYANWHKEQVQDDMIKEELRVLSGGALDFVPGDMKMRFNSNNNNNNFKKHAQNNNPNRPKNNAQSANAGSGQGNSSNNNKNRSGNNSHYNKNQKPNNGNRPHPPAKNL